MVSTINGKQESGRRVGEWPALRYTATTCKTKPQTVLRAEEWPGPRYVEGVILLDCEQKVLAFDEGAATILKDPRQPETEKECWLQVPEEILRVLQDWHSSDGLSRKFRIQLSSHTYFCRVHVAPSRVDGLPARITVLHLARELNMDDALTLIGAEYRLTARELQALRGILAGLSGKEVAEEMSISPNTVKAFLRLVMGKMGVSSRTGIVAKLFEPNGRG